MTCLNDLSDEDDLKMDKVKLKILPLLRGNQLLTDWFLECFPDERPSEITLTDYETLTNLRKEVNNIADTTEVYEYIPPNEILADPIENPCQLKYMNGRICYGNRIILPAKLSFLVTNHMEHMPNTSSIVGITPLHQQPQLQLEQEAVDNNDNHNVMNNDNIYTCVHNIKQYGDNKLKEYQKSNSDIDTNIINSNENELITDVINEEGNLYFVR